MPLLAQSCWDFSTNLAQGKLRPKGIAVVFSYQFGVLVGFLLKQISIKMTIFLKESILKDPKENRLSYSVQIAGDQKVWNPNRPLLRCFLQVVLRK